MTTTNSTAVEFFDNTIHELLERQHRDLLAHRERVADYDLSALDAASSQPVDITFFRPPTARLMNGLYTAKLLVSGLIPEVEVDAKIDSTLQEYREQNDLATPRRTSRQHGNRTVNFIESTEETGANFRINNTDFHLHGSTQNVADYMPDLLKLHESIARIQHDDVESHQDFPAKVSIYDGCNVAVDEDATLHVSPAMLRKIPARVWPDILRHERGHAINRDADEMRLEAFGVPNLAETAEFLHELNQLAETETTPSHYFFEPDFNRKFAQDMGVLADVLAQSKQLSAHIRQFPDYDELDSLGFAVDLNEQTGLLHHLQQGTRVEGLEDAIDIASQFMEEINPPSSTDSEGKGDVSLQQAYENFARFKATLQRVNANAAEPRTTLRRAHENIMHAQEHLADVEAVKHAENPREVQGTYRFIKRMVKDIPEDQLKTHPRHDTRISNAKTFAERVLQMRENDRNQGTQR